MLNVFPLVIRRSKMEIALIEERFKWLFSGIMKQAVMQRSDPLFFLPFGPEHVTWRLVYRIVMY